MTKPALPPSTTSVDVVEIEIDAMDGMEWEQGQRTPQASDANLAALVKESANAPEPAAPEPPRKTPLKARARATGPASPPRARAGNAPAAAAPTASSTSWNDSTGQVTRVGHVEYDGYAPRGSVAARGHDRPMSPAPAGVARAGSPALERAPSSASPEASTPLLDELQRRGPERVAAASTGAPTGSPPSLNDILRASPRPPRVDSAAVPVLLPLPPPAESVGTPVPRVVRNSDAPSPSGHREPGETGGRLGSASWRRLLLVIGATAGCAVLVTAVVVMTGGTSDEHASPAPVEDPVQDPAVPARGGAAPVAPVTAVTPPVRPASATARPAAPPEPEPPARRVSLALATAPAPSVAPGQPGRRPVRKHGSKKLVNDYSTRTNEAAMPGLVAQAAEDPEIGLARTAYLSGNQQLFAGDAAGAIRAYRESLSIYPGYVGGYRGLGLAYAQLGDNQNALEAFQMYVDTVPGAKDVALIKKRILRLQGK